MNRAGSRRPWPVGRWRDFGRDIRNDENFMETNKDSPIVLFYGCGMSIMDDYILGPRA